MKWLITLQIALNCTGTWKKISNNNYIILLVSSAGKEYPATLALIANKIHIINKGVRKLPDWVGMRLE